MKKYTQEELLPYFQQVKEKLQTPSVKPLLIFVVFKAHRNSELFEYMTSSGFQYWFISASCTGELQPLDLTVNAHFKTLMKDNFIKWYANKVAEDLI